MSSRRMRRSKAEAAVGGGGMEKEWEIREGRTEVKGQICCEKST